MEVLGMVLRLFLMVFMLMLFCVVGPVLGDPQTQKHEKKALEIDFLLAKKEITWGDIVRLAELTSPILSAAKNDVGVQAAWVEQAAAYPNPTIGLDIGEMSISDPDDRKEKLSLVQSLIVGGRRGARMEAAQANHEIAINQALDIRRDVTLSLRTMWLEEFHYRKLDAALLDLLALANSTLDIARTRFEAKAAPESQVTRALLDVYRLEVQRQEYSLARLESQAELMALLGGVDIPMERFSDLGDSFPEVMADLLQMQTITDHPAQLAALLGVDSAKANLHRVKAERIPDLDIFVAYGRNHGADDNFLETGISLPFPLFDRSHGLIAAHKAEVALAWDQAQLVDNKLQNQLAVARHRYLNARDQLEVVAGRILPAAERGLEQAQQGYRVGRVQFLELMDAQSTLGTVRLRSIELNREMARAEAQLMSLAGAGICN
jgi:outer membrane protein, heavy metal efflux system